MSESEAESTKVAEIPCWKLCSYIVRRANQAVFRESASEEGQLAQADGPGFFLNPSAACQFPWRVLRGIGRGEEQRTRLVLRRDAMEESQWSSIVAGAIWVPRRSVGHTWVCGIALP